jgi:response regulator RpfG family c-di-GMP phosphodiesterase
MERLLTKLNGLQVCSKLKEGEETKNIPVIFLTMLDSETDIIEGLNAGADDYIKKPFSPDELLARIARVLSRYRSVKGEYRIKEESERSIAPEDLKNKIIEKVEGYFFPFCRKLFQAVDIISDRLKKVEIKLHLYTDNPKSYYEAIATRIEKFDPQESKKVLNKEIEYISKLQSFLNRTRKNIISLLPFIAIVLKIEMDLKNEKQGAFTGEVNKRRKEIYTILEKISLYSKKLSELNSLLAGLSQKL